MGRLIDFTLINEQLADVERAMYWAPARHCYPFTTPGPRARSRRGGAGRCAQHRLELVSAQSGGSAEQLSHSVQEWAAHESRRPFPIFNSLFNVFAL